MSEDNCETIYYPDGRIATQTWHNDKNELHRLDGPAHIYWSYDDYILRYESWYINGQLHRDEGPAVMKFKNEKCIGEKWYHNGGTILDEILPGEIHYDDNGKIINMNWYWGDYIFRKTQKLINKENNLYECTWFGINRYVIKKEIICEDLVKSSI